MTGCARGCAILVTGAFVAILLFFAWPYRSESIESLVSGNDTGCTISTTSNGGWRHDWVVPGIPASRVAYPLKVFVFVEACRGVPGGRPYSAELVSLTSGKAVASGLSCANSRYEEEYPCRLEIPPLPRLGGHDRYRVRVVRSARERPRTAQMRLILQREWRSIVLAAIMSV
jgi:hypothetical protein